MLVTLLGKTDLPPIDQKIHFTRAPYAARWRFRVDSWEDPPRGMKRLVSSAAGCWPPPQTRDSKRQPRLIIGFDVRRFAWSRILELEAVFDAESGGSFRKAWVDFTEVVAPFGEIHLRAADAVEPAVDGSDLGVTLRPVPRGSVVAPLVFAGETSETSFNLREFFWFMEGAWCQAATNYEWTDAESAAIRDVPAESVEAFMESLASGPGYR